MKLQLLITNTIKNLRPSEKFTNKYTLKTRKESCIAVKVSVTSQAKCLVMIVLQILQHLINNKEPHQQANNPSETVLAYSLFQANKVLTTNLQSIRDQALKYLNLIQQNFHSRAEIASLRSVSIHKIFKILQEIRFLKLQKAHQEQLLVAAQFKEVFIKSRAEQHFTVGAVSTRANPTII